MEKQEKEDEIRRKVAGRGKEAKEGGCKDGSGGASVIA